MFTPKYLKPQHIEQIFANWFQQAELKCAEAWLLHHLNPSEVPLEATYNQAKDYLEKLENEMDRWLHPSKVEDKPNAIPSTT